MKKLIGKQINEFAAINNNLPNYFGDRFYPANTYTQKRVNGEFVAKRYNSILDTIKEVNGTVYIQPHCIHVTYNKGSFTIARDILTDTFLIPKLQLIA